MGRKKHQEEHENHERWLVSYADFITLLFAFFVVMYAISSLNEGKYKVLSQTLVAAFTGTPERPDAIPVGIPYGRMPEVVDLPPLPRPTNLSPVPRSRGVTPKPAKPTPEQTEVQQNMDALARYLRSVLAGPISAGDVQVRTSALGVVIDIHDTVLFASGQDTLAPQSASLLGRVAVVLKQIPYAVQVNGFTDDQPIHNAQFRSNWALSAARAVSVVEMFIGQGVSPQQLVAAGYGEYHPVASNATATGRAENRRVSVVIVSPDAKAGAVDTPMAGARIPAAGQTAVPPPAAVAPPPHAAAVAPARPTGTTP